jgi:16S rRNA (cytidine1402-2'-O)-methyltransferase
MLTLVPTPIGNLEDISFRVIKALKDGTHIFCEDTRVTKKLINLLDENFQSNITLNKQFYSLHSHNEEDFLTDKFKQLFIKEHCIYVSDAGMPCISDPGAKLVNFCIDNQIEYEVLPGANALLTAYAMSGLMDKEFIFFGFLPHKTQNRKSQLSEILNNKFPTILYESPHRIEQLIDELISLDDSRIVFVAKELTKLHQKSFKSIPSKIKAKMKELDSRGEWVVIIDKNHNQSTGSIITKEDIQSLSLKPKEKAKLLSKLTGLSVKEIYNNF